MSDIVAEARELATIAGSSVSPTDLEIDLAARLWLAANEIERLRALLLDAAGSIGGERCSHYPEDCGPDVKGCCVSDLYRAIASSADSIEAREVRPDQFPDAGKMVDLSGKIAPEGEELMKIAEQFRAMNPPWFKAISDAASRIPELEVAERARRTAEIHELELRQIHKEDRTKIHELEAKLAEVERDLIIANGHGNTAIEEWQKEQAKAAKLREALEAHERFFKKLSDRFWDCYEVDAGDFQEWGVECGLLKIEPYDPEKHGECDYGSEPGDDWYVPSSIARAALKEDGE